MKSVKWRKEVGEAGAWKRGFRMKDILKEAGRTGWSYLFPLWAR